jgi:hypothetical protein
MDLASGGDLVPAWWDYVRRSQGSRAERKALSLGDPSDAVSAYDAVARVVESGGQEAVELLVALNDAAPAGDDGVTVGCGPLEDLLHEHGDSVATTVNDHALSSPSFARALSHVWLQQGQLSEATENQLKAWVPSLTRGV